MLSGWQAGMRQQIDDSFGFLRDYGVAVSGQDLRRRPEITRLNQSFRKKPCSSVLMCIREQDSTHDLRDECHRV